MEMKAQVGDLTLSHGVATRGLLVRHLVLPGGLAGTRRIIGWIADNLGPQTALSLMSQYYPAYSAAQAPSTSTGASGPTSIRPSWTSWPKRASTTSSSRRWKARPPIGRTSAKSAPSAGNGGGGRANFAPCACLSGPQLLTYTKSMLRRAGLRSRRLSSKFSPAPSRLRGVTHRTKCSASSCRSYFAASA